MKRNESPIPQVLASVDQACLALGIGRTAFYTLVKQGVIRTVKIGPKGTRVPITEIESVPERLRQREQAA